MGQWVLLDIGQDFKQFVGPAVWPGGCHVAAAGSLASDKISVRKIETLLLSQAVKDSHQMVACLVMKLDL